MFHQRWVSALAPVGGLALFLALGPAAMGQHSGDPAAHVRTIAAAARDDAHEAGQSLDKHGLSIHSVFVNDLSKSPISSHGDHDWFSRYSLDLSMDVDGQKAMQWKGASFHVDLKKHANVAGQMYAQVAQGYSNIDADAQMYLYETWMVQSLAQNRIEVQVGQIDANTKFAAVATASDFLNSSMGYSPTIMNFPTYPEPKPGLDVVVNLPASHRLAVGGFETDGGRMALAEGGKKWALGTKGAPGNVELGYWRLHQPLITRNDEQVTGTDGFYAVVEQQFWTPDAGADGDAGRKLTGFVQLGTGDDRENSFGSHVGLGTVLQSPFSQRMADSIGVAATQVRIAGHSDNGSRAYRETVSEEYYKLALKSNVALVVDAQYFVNPGGGAHSSPFFVLTPRLVLTF
ncbi:MAG TPA: carbohydrate porin [Terracidiphilus sp.]|nr:carbohydrate porin [Terracidiphilus sp.]